METNTDELGLLKFISKSEQSLNLYYTMFFYDVIAVNEIMDYKNKCRNGRMLNPSIMSGY